MMMTNGLDESIKIFVENFHEKGQGDSAMEVNKDVDDKPGDYNDIVVVSDDEKNMRMNVIW